MKTHPSWSTVSTISAFLLGVILFWAFGDNWLVLESILIFLVGLIGVAVAVLGFALWKIHHNSIHKD